MSSAAYPPPVNPSDLGRGPAIIGVTWAFTILAVTAVGVRLYLRGKLLRSIGWDDWIMLTAVILQVANQSCLSEAYHYGLGKHDADLTIAQLLGILKWNWIASAPGMLVSVLARISICLLLVRLFAVHKWFKWFMIVTTILQSTFGILILIFTWAQVTPVTALWEPFLPSHQRINPTALLDIEYIGQSLYTFADLTYALLPIMIIWGLKMNLRQRIGLGLLLSFSIFTMILSILKLIRFASVSTTSLDTPDAQYTASLTVLFTGLEQTNVIIMGCVPTLRAIANLDLPILKSFFSSMSSKFSSLKYSNWTGSWSREKKGYSSSSGTDVYHDLEMNSSAKGLTHPNAIKVSSGFEVSTHRSG